VFARVLREILPQKMKEITENVVVDVATRKKPYVTPEIQVYEMEVQSLLLVNSPQYFAIPTIDDMEREDI